MNLIRNTLVRDRTPERLKEHGIKSIITELVGDELRFAFQKKLVNESQLLSVAEHRHEIINSIADISEVLAAFCAHMGISDTEISKAMGTRRREEGGYKEAIFLFMESTEPLPELAASMAK